MASQDTPSAGGGGKITDWVHPGDKSGEFKRQQSSFRDWVSGESDAKFPAEKGRYHLYISYACPWAHRTLIARKLKGLEDVVSFSAVHWHMGDKGWRFPTRDEAEAEADEDEDEAQAQAKRVIPDPLPGHETYTHLRDVYLATQPDYGGRFTVPVLYDKTRRTIVSNESSEILRMLGGAFDHVVDAPARDDVVLYPEPLRERIDAAHAWIYDAINNGVYKAGFATTQAAYEASVHALFDALDRAEAHLRAGPGPFWFGDTMTEVDVRLFVTMIRFDPVYVQHFKCNVRDIRSGYPALHTWLRTLYWKHAAFGETTDFAHIKKHYTRSHPQINPFAITPVGPLPDVLPLHTHGPAAGAAAAATAASR